MTTSKDPIKQSSGKLTLKSYMMIFFIVVAANIITHVFIEVYNDWDSHIEAFEEGVEESKKANR